MATEANTATEKQILFGDAHVHTTWSFDAFMFSLPVLNASRGRKSRKAGPRESERDDWAEEAAEELDEDEEDAAR